MAEKFIDELARVMGWKVERETAYGIWQGYLFTVVRSEAGVTYTDAWLYKQGTISDTSLEEYFDRVGVHYRMTRAPKTQSNGIEAVQHMASIDEVKEMIQSLAAWMSTTGARSGCARCGRINENAFTMINGVPVYQCAECGRKTTLGLATGSSKAGAGNTQGYVDGPEGIGGWLILFIIGRFIDIVLFLVDLAAVNSPDVQALNRIGMGYIIPIAISLDVLLMALDITIIILIFQKKLLFRTLFLIYTVLNLAVAYVVPLVICSILDVPFQPAAQMISSTIAVFLWVLYLFASKRVRNTFTRFERKEKYTGRGFGVGPATRNDTFGS